MQTSLWNSKWIHHLDLSLRLLQRSLKNSKQICKAGFCLQKLHLHLSQCLFFMTPSFALAAFHLFVWIAEGHCVLIISVQLLWRGLVFSARQDKERCPFLLAVLAAMCSLLAPLEGAQHRGDAGSGPGSTRLPLPWSLFHSWPR